MFIFPNLIQKAGQGFRNLESCLFIKPNRRKVIPGYLKTDGHSFLSGQEGEELAKKCSPVALISETALNFKIIKIIMGRVNEDSDGAEGICE